MYKKGKKYYEQNSGQIVIYSLLALTGYISQISIQVYILMSCIHNIHILNIEISHCISGEHIKMLRFTMALRSMRQCP